MSPRRFKLLAILSLLACLTFIALWPISYRGDRALHWGEASRLTLTRGQIVLQWPVRDRYARFIDGSPGWNVFGFSWIGNEMIVPNVSIPAVEFREIGQPSINLQIVSTYRNRKPPLILCGTVSTITGLQFVVLGRETGVPIWLLVAMAMILPAKWLLRARRQRRLALVGLCRVCHYDLRASTDRCPECGTAFVRRRRSREVDSSPPTTAAPLPSHGSES